MKKVWTLLVLLCLVVGLCFALASCGETEHTEHTWDDGKVTKAATCTVAGTKLYTCTECGETKTEEVKALGHDFSETYEKDGENHWQICSRCNAEVNLGAHNYVEDTEAGVAPTCNTAGKKVLKCEVCGDTQETPVRATGEHTKGTELKFDEKQHWYECTVCGTHLEPKNHDIEKGEETGLSSDSCKPGERTDACKECDYEVKMSVDSGVLHTYTFALNIAEKKLTATCSVCHNVREMTYAFGDDFSSYEDNIPGKMFDGSNIWFSDNLILDEDGNKYVELHGENSQIYHNASYSKDKKVYAYEGVSFRVQLKFTKDGEVVGTDALQVTDKFDNKWDFGGYKDIQVIDGKFSAAGVQTDVEVVADEWLTVVYLVETKTGKLTFSVTDKNGMTATMTADANATMDGTTYLDYWRFYVKPGNTCRIDDIMYWRTDVGVHEHKLDAGTKIKDVTCTPGEIKHTCTVCGAEVIEYFGEKETTDHTPGTEFFYEDEEGNPNTQKHWHKCDDCGAVCGEEEHSFTEDESRRVPATTTENGKKYMVCACGYEYVETISAHSYTYALAEKDGVPTLTATCSTCSEKIEFTYIIGDTFDNENSSIQPMIDGSNTWATSSSIVTMADGNKVAKMTGANAQLHFEKTYSPNGYTDSSVKGKEYAKHNIWGVSFRVQFAFTDGDTVKKCTNLQLTTKFDGGWDYGGFKNITVGEDNKVNLGGFESGMEVETDKWYTITYVYFLESDKAAVMITNEAGETKMGDAQITFASAKGATYFTYWLLKVIDANEAALIDNYYNFYAD